MPPKRKHVESVTSPDQESKKESKEEKKKRIEAEKIRAKKWAEERKARAARSKPSVQTSATENEIQKPKTTKRARKSTSSSAAVDGHASPSSPVKATSPKKKKPPASATRQSETSDREIRKEGVDRKKKVEDETEEEAVKPRVKRRKLTTDSNGDEKEEKPRTPAMKSSTREASKPTEHFMSPETANIDGNVSIPVVQSFMSPEAVASVQDLRSNIVYVPVNVAGLQSVHGKVKVSAPGEARKESFPVFSPEAKNISFAANLSKVSSSVVTANVPEKDSASTKAVSKATWRQTVEVQNEEEEEVKEELATKKPYAKSSLLSTFMDNLVKCTALSISLSMLLFLITSLILPTNDSHMSVPTGDNVTTSFSTNTTPCYSNFGFGGENEEMDLPCKDPVDCPVFGRCEGGKLVDCLLQDISWDGESFYVPSESGDKCVPSPNASQAMVHLQNVLIDLSVEYVCRSNIGLGPVCRVPTEDIFANGAITFDSKSVGKIANFTLAEMDILLKHIKNEDIIYDERKDGDIIFHVVGLSQEYVTTKLPIPLACYLRMLAWDVFRLLSAFLYGGIKMFLSLIWSITVSSPIPTFFFGTALYLIFWVYHKRSKIAGLRKESSKIQNIAYDKLIMDCNEGEGYAALHLRDEIAHELYPEPCSARARFNTIVWPRVVALVRSDNRVIKTRKTIGGKSLEWWEWVADSSRKSRRSLAAGNTIVANEGESATKKAKFE